MELFRKLKNLCSAVEERRGKRKVDVFVFYCSAPAVEVEHGNLSPFIRSLKIQNFINPAPLIGPLHTLAMQKKT